MNPPSATLKLEGGGKAESYPRWWCSGRLFFKHRNPQRGQMILLLTRCRRYNCFGASEQCKAPCKHLLTLQQTSIRKRASEHKRADEADRQTSEPIHKPGQQRSGGSPASAGRVGRSLDFRFQAGCSGWDAPLLIKNSNQRIIILGLRLSRGLRTVFRRRFVVETQLASTVFG